MADKKCSFCGTILPELDEVWPHTEAACVNELYRKQQKWLVVLGMMEAVVAAHPCKAEGCSCREIRKKIGAELDPLKKEEIHGEAS